jgi:VanZ family protein
MVGSFPVREVPVRRSFKLVLKLPALVLAAGIWCLSSQSVLPTPKGIFGFDKFQHFLAYFALGAAIALWFSQGSWRRPGLRIPALTAALGSAYGIVDEIHQYFVPNRSCTLGDWITDTLGAVAAAAAVKLILVRIRRD